MKLVIAVLLFATVASYPISSGYSARKLFIKCYVALVIEGETGSKTCGGCLLYPEDKIVTAANCVFSRSEGKASTIKVFTGLAGPSGSVAKVFSVYDIYKTADYDEAKATSGGDIAVIVLNKRVKASSTLSATYPLYEDRADAYVGKNLVVCGHGFIDNNNSKPGSKGLQCTTLRVVPAAECVALITPQPTTTAAEAVRRKRQDTTSSPDPAVALSKGIICTRNNDDRNVCGGDTGSPVFSNKTGVLSLVGVVSIFPDSRGRARCKDGHYTVITQIGTYKDFVSDPIKFSALTTTAIPTTSDKTVYFNP